MSTLHNTAARLLAWVRRRALLLTAFVVVMAVVVIIFVLTFRLYDERQARLDAVAEQTRMNRMINHDLCVGLNEANGSVRFILDSGLRLRSSANPLSDQLRQAYIDAYRQLPERNCETGEKTYYDPPFPPTPTTGGS